MKVLLLDADGVVLKRQGQLFSERFIEEYGAPREQVVAFFKNEFRLCQAAKADLKDELVKRLSAWGWNKPTDEFLNYWFKNSSVPDEEVLARIAQLRSAGVRCYLASNQERYRGAYIKREYGLDGYLDGYFFSGEIGHLKSEPEFFEHVLRTLAISPSEIMFFDDDQKNIDVAADLGIDARFYTSIDDLRNLAVLQ